jgi:hypothetical protein
MYGQGAGTVIFPPHSSMDSCPQGLASPQAAIAAVVITAAAGAPAEELKQQVDTLLHIYGSIGEELRAAFHLFISLDGHDAQLRDLAAHYVYQSLGMVKLVQFAEAGPPASSNSSSSSGTGGGGGGETITEVRKRGMLQQQSQQQQHTAAGGVASDASGSSVRAAGASNETSISTSSPSYGAHSQADHQRFMLHIMLDCFKYPAVLFLSSDMELSPDLFGYLAATQWLLLSDSSLYCVSAWNEFGRLQMANSVWSLLRTDYHPARAWIITAAVGQELLGLWRNSSISSRGRAAGEAGKQQGVGVGGTARKVSGTVAEGWGLDASMVEWMGFIRRPDVRRGRQCILPERPRVVSKGG